MGDWKTMELSSGAKIMVATVAGAFGGVQFVVGTGVGEIVSVGFILDNGRFTWKYGGPSKKFRKEIEEKIRKMLT